MLLQDHFHPPLSLRRHWHAFHNAWATYIAADLNQRLPEGYFAEPNVQFGIEIDVAAFEEPVAARNTPLLPGRDNGGSPPGGTAVWPVPTPTRSIALTTLGDVVEVLLYFQEGGPSLAGAIELVSPSNKDRASHREAFVSKCAAYLQQGVGLAMVDVVTGRSANLHGELLDRLGAPGSSVETSLYAVAYRPVSHAGNVSLDMWETALEVRRPLPTLPLWLRGPLCLPLDLDATYERTCREQRIVPMPDRAG